MDVAINALEGESWTPLGETLFQLYTYFMSRTAREPADGRQRQRPSRATSTARTRRATTGSYTTTASPIPEDPVQFDCQKNFVIIITDGEPTKDDFDNSNCDRQHGAGLRRASPA